MAFKPLLPKTEYMRLPIPDYPKSKLRRHPPLASPFRNPQPMERYPRKWADGTLQKPEVWLILITAASVIGMSKMKENSVINSSVLPQIRRRTGR